MRGFQAGASAHRFLPLPLQFGFCRSLPLSCARLPNPLGSRPPRRMPVDYFTPTEFSRVHRPWYTRPWLFLPLIIGTVVVVAALLAFLPVATSLEQQAAGFDLSHLEQM